MASTEPSYHEHVESAAWFALIVRLLVLAPLLGVIAAVRDPELSANERTGTIVLLGAASIVLGIFAPWLLSVRIDVDPQVLRFRIGPFRRTLVASTVATARVERYSALAYGGWGWRFEWRRGRAAQAYTVPFLRTGVQVTTREGRTYYISSRAPQRLAQAIVTMQRGAGPG
jgi:hypothetical protein